jgi:aspartokinase/homoserine dehydrogenase 1
VVLEPILSPACLEAKSLESFFKQLESEDGKFEKKRALLESESRRLRYIASLENGKASVALKSVSPDDPFYSLSGSDNMIVFTTERYHDRPLVIKGPGAGAEVTAAGVFADILRIANYLS